MKPDYKNWMPKGMVFGFFAGAVITFVLALVFGGAPFLSAGAVKLVLMIIFCISAVVFCCLTIWAVMLYRAFDYNGKRQMAKQIIEGTAAYVNLPDGGKILDVGCGSGAPAIAAAKRNPKAEVTGIDRWGKEYASFSQTLCENNAKAEGVSNIRFQKGDATKLEFPDETFDAVISNYVYHNIPVKDRQAVLLETLRTLKKGGVFAIHDIFSSAKYGDMDAFVKKLKDMGYPEIEMIDTTDGLFMKKSEAVRMTLSGSALFVGIKG